MKNLVHIHVSVGMIGLWLFLLNLYWLIATLAGGIAFGIGPATVTLFEIIADDDANEKKLSNKGLFTQFLTCYKHNFKQANKQFLPLIFFGLLLLAENYVMRRVHFTNADGAIRIMLLVLMIVLITVILEALLLFGAQPENTRDLYKRALILLVGRPINSLGIFIICLGLFSLYYILPGVGIVFGMSLLGYAESIYASKIVTALSTINHTN